MYKATYSKKVLNFNFTAQTSRGIIEEHTIYLLKIWHISNPEIVGVGEAAPLKGLSIDYRPDFETFVSHISENINDFDETLLEDFPAIRFAVETALIDLESGGKKHLYHTDFYNGKLQIPINGLVWIAQISEMKNQILKKVSEGYSTVKLKIGANNFEDEIELLKAIRKEFSEKELVIRLDANGAFEANLALDKLHILSQFAIHSVEQPILQGQTHEMANLCKYSPIPIALDEELIGKFSLEQKWKLLYDIKPKYVICKPTLLGGFSATEEWIMLAESLNIGWWLTSALESNIGLNAIAQFASKYNLDVPQGLGTGNLYNNNIQSPLTAKNGLLFYNKNASWDNI